MSDNNNSYNLKTTNFKRQYNRRQEGILYLLLNIKRDYDTIC